MLLKQSTARNVMIFMVDSSDHISGKASLTLTITASKDCAAFASITPTVTERGNGWYALDLTTSHTDTLGDFALHITGTGADPTDMKWQVVSLLPGEVAPVNLTQIDGLATSGNNAILNLRKIVVTPQSGENALNITMPSQSPGSGNRVPAAMKIIGGAATGGDESGGHAIELIGGGCNGFGTGGNGLISTGGNATGTAGDGFKGVGGTGAGAGTGISGVGAVASVSGNVLGTLFGRVLGLEATNTTFVGTVTSTTATLFDVSTLAGDNAIKGCRVAHFDATGKLVQTRIITNYVHSTQVITVDEAWSTNPINFDGCRIYYPLAGNVDVAINNDKTGYSPDATTGGKIDAIKAKTDNLPASPAATSDVPTANQNADALLDRANALGTGYTPRMAMKLGMAADGGKVDGAATNTLHVRNPEDTKNVVTAVTDADGNRTAVTLDLT